MVLETTGNANRFLSTSQLLIDNSELPLKYQDIKECDKLMMWRYTLWTDGMHSTSGFFSNLEKNRQ